MGPGTNFSCPLRSVVGEQQRAEEKRSRFSVGHSSCCFTSAGALGLDEYRYNINRQLSLKNKIKKATGRGFWVYFHSFLWREPRNHCHDRILRVFLVAWSRSPLGLGWVSDVPGWVRVVGSLKDGMSPFPSPLGSTRMVSHKVQERKVFQELL